MYQNCGFVMSNGTWKSCFDLFKVENYVVQADDIYI